MYKLDESWKDIKTIVIYGFGKTAKGSIDYFIDNFEVLTIIDNDCKYRNNSVRYRDIPILNFDQFISYNKRKEKIVILAAGKALISIKEYLNKNGLQEFMDYVNMDIFFEEWFYRFRNKVHIGKITTSVTTRCTFNCKYCNMLMPYYNAPNDYSYEMLCKDADLLFSLVDYVSVFVIIGGEPFLYHDLNRYLKNISEVHGGVLEISS